MRKYSTRISSWASFRAISQVGSGKKKAEKIIVITIWIHACLQSGGLCLVSAPQYSLFPFKTPTCKYPFLSYLLMGWCCTSSCSHLSGFARVLPPPDAPHRLSAAVGSACPAANPPRPQRAEEHQGGNEGMAPSRKIQHAHRWSLLRFPTVWMGIHGEIQGPSLNFCQLVDVY